MIRLVMADDHEMVREGFRRIVEAHPDMEIVAEAADGDEVMGVLEKSRPDVLLLDVSMPGPGFLRVMELVTKKYPDLPVLVVSMHAEEHWAVQALKAGAAGYLTKTHSAEELAEGIRRVRDGRRYITPQVADALARQFGVGGHPSSIDALSRREFEVLRRLGSGKMVKTVARELDLSPKTVSTYRTRILEKLGLSSNSELIRFAMKHDLVD
jgi:DNA-binding NarL/FixJ family response regulator